jgi:hypothetical protein
VLASGEIWIRPIVHWIMPVVHWIGLIVHWIMPIVHWIMPIVHWNISAQSRAAMGSKSSLPEKSESGLLFTESS